MIGDALGSVGAVLAGLFMYQFGWYIADPILSILMSVFILKGAWSVIRQSVHILMKGTPPQADVGAINAALKEIDGVVNVHDIHVWTVASSYEVFSCHVLVRQGIRSSQILSQAIPMLEKRFGIRHATIQVVEEDVDMSAWSCQGGTCIFSVMR